MPGFGREAQHQEFGRQGAAARRALGVDSPRIGREHLPARRREKRDIGRGGAVEAEHPHLPIDRQSLLPEDFGEPAGAVTPHQLHLEQPVLGMDKAEAEGGVRAVPGEDQRHAVGIAQDANRMPQPGDGEAPLRLRQ